MSYAIVHQSRVILGPVAWNQKYMTSVLKIRHQISANIPGQPPAQLPYEINSQTRIHEVEEIRPEFDSMTHYLQGPSWNLTTHVIQAAWTVMPQPIESARNNFRELAAQERYRKETAGVTAQIQGTTVTADTSRDGRAIFLQALTLMPDGGTINWKFPEGWFTLTKPELTLVVGAGAAHIQAAFDWEKSINDQIDLADSAEALKLIEILPPQPDSLALDQP